jgi:hypothetical protein
MEPIAAQPVKITPQLCIHITLCGYITLTPTHKNGPDHTLTQCLGKRRIEDIAALRKQARAWNRRVNKDKATIQWKFTRQQARTTLHYTITRSKH